MQLKATTVSLDRGELSRFSALAGASTLHIGEGLRTRSIARAVAAFLVFAGFLGCCQPNDPNCKTERIGPSGAEVFGVALGVGAVAATSVVLGVQHAHHTLKGCVVDTPAGLELHTKGGQGAYVLGGSTGGIKAGERVSLHGKREKQKKGSVAAPQFKVEHENKDYGPCPLPVGASVSAP